MHSLLRTPCAINLEPPENADTDQILVEEIYDPEKDYGKYTIAGA